MNINFKQNVLPHLLSLVIGFLVILFFYHPVFDGKELVQSDMLQVSGQLQEAHYYQETTGEPILWSNSTFGGMPVWRGFETSIMDTFHRTLIDVFPTPVLMTFLCYAGFYLLLLVLGVSPWIAVAGSFAYAFSTFSIISIEAGHANKVFAMAFMAPVLAGVIRSYQGKYLSALLILIIATGFQVFYGHIQISYYLLIVLLFFTISELIKAIQKKNYKNFIVASLICVVGAGIAVGPNVSRLWTMAEYAKYSTRGKSELTSKKEQGDGLDKDYAFQWSYGKMETFTLLIPNFYGGSSHAELSKKSETYKTLVNNNVSPAQAEQYIKKMPLYWGDQPFTSGPVYIGAAVCFLFIMGLVLVRSRIKWWITGVAILSILLSWGNNLEWFSDFFFYNVPLYNKFRSVTMILAVTQLVVPVLGFLALQKIINAELSKEELLSGVKVALGITGGLALFFAILGPGMFEFVSSADQQFPPAIVKALREDRASALTKDGFRSLFFIVVTAAAIWYFIKGKLKKEYLFGTLILVMIIDLWPVAKRHLDASDFQDRQEMEAEVFKKTKADVAILDDKDPYYRVFNVTGNPFSDALTSYYHKSVGGYSAIKLGKYQELIDHHLSKNNMDVLNMLNVKYFIVQDKNTGEPRAVKNDEALGNAWFVDSVRIVPNADEEIAALGNFKPQNTAVVDQRFKDELPANISRASGDSVGLVSYHPDNLEYRSHSASGGLAVFSDVYYPDWKAYVDGKEVPIIRVNYLLRGLALPQGDHKIEFKFLPEYYFAGEKVSLYGSIIFCLAIVAIIAFQIFKNKRRKERNDEITANTKETSFL